MISKTFIIGLAVSAKLQMAFADELEQDEENDRRFLQEYERDSRTNRFIMPETMYDQGWFSDQNPVYDVQTRHEKLAQLWERLVPDENDRTVQPATYQYKKFDNFFTQNANGSFCFFDDELPGRHEKTTHTQGLVAKVEWRKFENGITDFTGIYESGSTEVIMRLSETHELTTLSEGLVPGAAFKFLIDGKISENLLAMPNMTGRDEEGSTSWDFFHRPFQSRVERFSDSCERDTKEKKFIEASNRPYATGVSMPARYELDGTNHDSRDARAPWGLVYTGTHNFEEDDPLVWYDQLRNQF